MAGKTYSYDTIRFSRKERLPNSFISTEVHPIESRGEDCLIVTAVEINSPWHHAREFGQQIVNALIREFVRSQSNSNLIRFEHALKIANHTISQAADKLGVTIDCAVALCIKQEVHFTVIGNSRLLLYRNSHLTDVTAADSSQPGQFSSVTSGDLADHEWLMIATQAAVPFLREQDPATWQETDGAALAAQLVDQAPAEERQNYFATLIRYREDTGGQSQTVLWDGLEHTTPIKLPKIGLPKFNLAPFATALGNFIASIRNRIRARRSAPRVESKESEEASSSSVDFSEDRISLLQRLTHWRDRLPRLNRRVVLMTLLLLVIIMVGYRAVIGRADRIAEDEPAPTLLAELAQIPTESRREFLRTKFDFERYIDLSDEDQARLSALVQEASLNFLEPKTVVTELDEEITALDSSGNLLVAIDRTGQLWRIQEGRTIKVEQALLVQNPRSIAIVNAERTVVTDASGNIWLFDSSGTTQPNALTQPPSLGSGPKLVQTYAGNLYIFVTENKTIFRQAAFDKEITAPRSAGSFNQFSVPLADWAINGQIVGINEQGQLIGLQAGRAALNGNAPHSFPPFRLATTEAAPKIAILSGQFLTLTDKTLTGPVTYFLAIKSSPTDLAIDAADSSHWLSAGKQIYKLTL